MEMETNKQRVDDLENLNSSKENIINDIIEKMEKIEADIDNLYEKTKWCFIVHATKVDE